jgi:ubiquinone/menaquinone biosynthesis C-methylase UbiE
VSLKKDIALKYDASAEIYDARYTSIQQKKYVEILSRVNIKKNASILDIGCGTGSLLNLLHQRHKTTVHRLVGVDLSFEMIKKAQQKNRNLDFLVADSDQLPFRDNAFDVVVSVTHLQNLPEPEKTTQELKRIAENKASIAISVLRKSWTLEKLKREVLQQELFIQDCWIADVEDVGLVCSKQE